MNIAILDDYQDTIRKLSCFNQLNPQKVKIYTNSARGVSQLTDRLKDANVLILNHARTQISRQVLEKLTQLKLIIQIGRITSHLDLEACTSLGIAVIEGEEPYNATAEFTWALIMSAMRRIPQYTSMLRHGGWQQSGLRQVAMPANFALGTTLKGKKLGIWGYGSIGKLIALYGKTFGMNVLIWGSDNNKKEAEKDGYKTAHSRRELFESSDVLTLHLRLNESNRRIVQLEDFLLMKPTSLFVNTANAALVETESLVSALNRGTPGLAAIDVYDTEPIMQGHALLRMENTICTPHLGCVDKENLERHYCSAFKYINDFQQGEGIPAVNPKVLSTHKISNS